MNTQFLFENNVKIGHAVAKDLATATTGNRLKMDTSERVCLLIAIAAGTAGVITPQLKQHNAATGGTSKVLDITNAYYHKVGAATSFTKVDVNGVAYNSLVLGATVGAAESLIAIEVLPEDLDTNNGFAYISVDFPVAGVARLATTLLVLEDSVFQPGHEISI
jgi:hypothetical protein